VSGRAGERAPRVAFVMEQVLGHATWSMNLRLALRALGVDAVWIETTLHREGGFPERVPGLPATVRAGLRGLLDVGRGLAGQRYDALVFNTQKAAAFCQPYLLRTPTLLMTDVTPAQYDRMGERYSDSAAGARPGALLKRAVNGLNFRLARGLVGWSRWTAHSFIHEYGAAPERVHVVPPGVDTDLWRPRQRALSTRPRLLFVGGQFDRKGGPDLIAAFSDLRLATRSELHVVTRDEVAPAPGVFVHRLDNGSDELRSLYAECDVFVLPTRADCFSIATIEAMASGLPAVVTDVGGIADIVVDGECGFLLRPGDTRGLRSALTALVDDAALRARLGEAARARAVRLFDAKASAARILEIASVVAARRPALATARS
jgi:starch synthase